MEREMTFSSQLDARQFLINKITAEAGRNGASLSDAERRMLQLNLDDPQSAIGIPVAMLEDKSRTFESKIVTLLQDAYKREDSQERQRYRDAVRALKNSDHYILIIATEAIPVRSRVSNSAVYVLIAVVIVLMILALHLWTKGR
jgi:hypothetical protein